MPSRPCANLTWIVGLASFSQQPKGPDCRPLIIGVCQAGRQVYVIGEIFQRFLNNGVRNTKGLASWLISPQVEGSPRRFPRLKIRITAEDLYEISRAWWVISPANAQRVERVLAVAGGSYARSTGRRGGCPRPLRGSGCGKWPAASFRRSLPSSNAAS